MRTTILVNDWRGGATPGEGFVYPGDTERESNPPRAYSATPSNAQNVTARPAQSSRSVDKKLAIRMRSDRPETHEARVRRDQRDDRPQAARPRGREYLVSSRAS